MTRTIGTCGACGGRVSVPLMWWSVIAPTPKCEQCGAVPNEPHGPVISMRRRRPKSRSETPPLTFR